MIIEILCKECGSVLSRIDTDQITDGKIILPMCFDCKQEKWNNGYDAGYYDAANED